MNTVSHLLREVLALADRIAGGLRWLSPAIARITVGTVFLQSGWGKLHALDDVTAYFAELGIPQAAFQARLASGTEFVCGGLLLLGLATRFAAPPLIVTMVVAIRTALWDQVDGLGSLVGLSEFAYIALLLWLATDGAGPLSLDRLAGRWFAGRAPQAMLPPTAAALPWGVR